MTARIDPLEQHERLSWPLTLSITLHAGIFASTLIVSMLNTPVLIGDPHGQPGGAVAVNVVQGIPLPRSRSQVENPVANPVKHDVPAIPDPPKAEERPAQEDPSAVPLESKPKKEAAARKPAVKKRQNPPPTPPNQVGSSTGGRVSSPIYSGQQTRGAGGGVGFGSGSPFGARFGWYADALQRRLADEWSKTLGQVAGASQKPVIVSFNILLDGRIENVRIASSSGNRPLDYSAVRAVVNTNPFRALPRELGKRSIQVEMTFQLE